MLQNINTIKQNIDNNFQDENIYQNLKKLKHYMKNYNKI